MPMKQQQQQQQQHLIHTKDYITFYKSFILIC